MAEEEKKQDEAPKIIADEDWKEQARAEKDKLAAEVESKGTDETADEPTTARQLPPASFTSLISMLVSHIILALGGIEDPETKNRYVDLRVARHYIDVLGVIEEKTKGNLSDEEKRLLDQSIYETRMQYVQIAQQATQA